MMSINKVIELVDANASLAKFKGAISFEAIQRAQEILGVKFPESYVRFLEIFGAGHMAGVEIYGIIQDPSMDKNEVPNAVWYTLDMRRSASLPKSMVVVSNTGYGPLIVIDTNSIKGTEAGIYLWYLNGESERINDSFGEFLFNELSQALSDDE